MPLMEFATEQFGAASREVFSGDHLSSSAPLLHTKHAGSVSQTEDIIDKHSKVMDKIDKKKKDVKDIITKGEKLTEMAKAPVKPPHRAPSVSLLLPGLPQGEAGGDEEPVGQDPQRLQGEAGRPQGDVSQGGCWSPPPQSNAMNWNNFAEKCQTLQTQVTSTLLYTTAPCTPRSPRPRNRSTTLRR